MEEKKESYKGIVIFLIALGIVAVTGTSFYANSIKNKIAGNDNSSNNVSSRDSGIDYQKLVEEDKKYVSQLDESYSTNNIKLLEMKYVSGEVIRIDEYDNEKIYQESINYYQIDGLKDDEIERKINDRLKEEAFKILQEEPTHNAKRSYMSVYGNFSNILSIYINSSQYNMYPWEENSSNIYTYINIDLSTGNEIRLEDLFVKGTSIKNLISTRAYEMSVYRELELYFENDYWDYLMKEKEKRGIDSYDWLNDEALKQLGIKTEKEWTREYTLNNYTSRIRIDESALREMINIKNEEIKLEYVNPDAIMVSVGNNSVYIGTRKILDKLVMYKRFVKGESIFTDEYNNSTTTLCGTYAIDTRQTGFLLDNFFLDYNCDMESGEYKNWADEKLEAEKEYASLNKDKVTFLTLSVGEYGCGSQKIETDRKIYEERKEEILKNIVAPHGNIEITYALDGLKIDFVDSSYKYIYKEYETGNIRMYDIKGGGVYLMDTDIRKIDSSELNGISLETLELVYNEIFARHGQDFQTKNFREYFGSRIWYKPVYKKTVSLDELSDIERANVQTIKDEIARRKA